MRNFKVITVLVFGIAVISAIASSSGIFLNEGPGSYEYMSIRGKSVDIYGKGLYRDMSSDVAIQGIAQDYVTLFIAIPLLLAAWYFSRKNSLKWRFILAGILNYFFVTYLMYLGIAMYNSMFLAYVFLIGASSFSLVITLMSFKLDSLPELFSKSTPVRLTGGFLVFNSIIISLMWLGIVLPPLISGTIIPDEVQHYTTLTVQGLDLALFLPVSFVSGYLLIKRKPMGFLLGTTTLVFLSFLMTALVAKITAMGMNGVSIIPAIFIIPLILVASVICALLLLRNLKTSGEV